MNDNEVKKQDEVVEEESSNEQIDELDNESFTYTVDNNNVSNDYNHSENKSFIYVIVGVVVLILVVVFLVIIANSDKSKVNGYQGVESSMVSAAKKYFDKNEELLPTVDGGSVVVSSETLIQSNVLKPFSEMVDNDSNCSGYVNVYKVGDQFGYFPFLSCGESYKSESLSNKIISDGVVSSGDGLYVYGDHYVYRGEYPNNYVKFDDKIWRIISINNDGSIKMILNEKKVEKNSWDDRYNSSKNSYSGINDFGVSRLSEYLNDLFTNEKYVGKSNKNYLVKHDWCIGKVSENDALISSLNLCNEVYSDSYYGVVQLDELLIPSLDSNCKYVFDNQCTNYNYFYSLNVGWTMNASSDRSYIAFSSSSGEIISKITSNSGYVRPVVNINSNTLYNGGEGTLEKPYVIGN